MLDAFFGRSGPSLHYECTYVPRHLFGRRRPIDFNTRFGDLGIRAGATLSVRPKLRGGGGGAHNSKSPMRSSQNKY